MSTSELKEVVLVSTNRVEKHDIFLDKKNTYLTKKNKRTIARRFILISRDGSHTSFSLLIAKTMCSNTNLDLVFYIHIFVDFSDYFFTSCRLVVFPFLIYSFLF